MQNHLKRKYLVFKETVPDHFYQTSVADQLETVRKITNHGHVLKGDLRGSTAS